MELLDVTTRRVRGYAWVRLALGKLDPYHGWMARGLVRRDTFTVKGWGVAFTAMPHSWPTGCDKCEREWPPPPQPDLEPEQPEIAPEILDGIAVRQEAIEAVAERLSDGSSADPHSWLHNYTARQTVDALLHEPELLARLAAIAVSE